MEWVGPGFTTPGIKWVNDATTPKTYLSLFMEAEESRFATVGLISESFTRTWASLQRDALLIEKNQKVITSLKTAAGLHRKNSKTTGETIYRWSFMEWLRQLLNGLKRLASTFLPSTAESAKAGLTRGL